MIRKTLLLLLALGLGGCSIADIPILFRDDTQQGAIIDDQAIARLRPGMSRDQVRFLMGTPAIQDPFHDDRWDYIYRRRPGWSDDTESHRITLYFNDTGLVRGEGNELPEDHPLANSG